MNQPRTEALIEEAEQSVKIAPWRDGIWYFAHPYTVEDEDGNQILEAQAANYRLACHRSAKLLERGVKIFSPIAHSHPIHMASTEFLSRGEQDVWYELDNALIDSGAFRGLILAPGWEDSAGCCSERIRFLNQEKPVVHYQNVIWVEDADE